MDAVAVKFVVAGRVQGVFYRAATSAAATGLGLDGWVRNLADGRVEVVARGDPAAVERLAAWLWQGPSAARVSSVALEEWRLDVAPGFRIESTL